MAEYISLIANANNYSVSTEKSNYSNAYATLNTYLTPLLADMSSTSNIDSSTMYQNFKSYYDKKILLITAISNSLKSSSVQLGTVYNNLVFDPTNGITATRSDKKVQTRMNATEGFKILKGVGDGSYPNTVFSVDSAGDTYIAGTLNAATGLQIGGVNVLTADNKIQGQYLEGKGLTIKNSSGITTFSIDSNGNVVLNGGSINWSSVAKPTYTASEVGARSSSWLPSANEIGAVQNNQTAVFNTLTNNGSLKGLYMQNNELYINADYIKTGTLIADRIRNSNGQNAYLVCDGDYGDLSLVRNGLTVFNVYNNGAGSITLQARNASGNINPFLSSSGSFTNTFGNWSFTGTVDFGGATVSGITAKFA